MIQEKNISLNKRGFFYLLKTVHKMFFKDAHKLLLLINYTTIKIIIRHRPNHRVLIKMLCYQMKVHKKCTGLGVES